MADTSTSEIVILSRVIDPEKPTLAPESARAILALDLSSENLDCMLHLSAKAQNCTLTLREKTEINRCERAGRVLNILQSKAH
jgi:hypothetical protein